MLLLWLIWEGNGLWIGYLFENYMVLGRYNGDVRQISLYNVQFLRVCGINGCMNSSSSSNSI